MPPFSLRKCLLLYLPLSLLLQLEAVLGKAGLLVGDGGLLLWVERHVAGEERN